MTGSGVLRAIDGGFFYFLVLRLRKGSRHDGGARDRQCRAFKWYARRALAAVLCLYPLSLYLQHLAAAQSGYVRVWQVGVIAFSFSDVVLLVLFGLSGAYLGYAVANLPLPRWPRWPR